MLPSKGVDVSVVMRRRQSVAAVAAAAVIGVLAVVPGTRIGRAATPASGHLSRPGTISWMGTFDRGGVNINASCNSTEMWRPLPYYSCDAFVLHVATSRVPARMTPWLSIRLVSVEPEGQDLDVEVYRNAGGDPGAYVDGSYSSGNDEKVDLQTGQGEYFIGVVAYLAQPGTTYRASATLSYRRTATTPVSTIKFEPALMPFDNCPAEFVTGSFNTCFEPTVAADPRGRIFAVATSGKEIAVSSNAGRLFTRVPVPPIPIPGVVPGDTILQVDRRGRLYYSTLLIGLNPIAIQVARSSDGARTWELNSVVGLPPGSGTISFGSDRQWLAFGPGDTVYLTYKQLPPVWLGTPVGFVPPLVLNGLMVLRSDDGGETFSPPTLIHELPGRQAYIPGPSVVDARGRLFVAFFSGQTRGPIDRLKVAVSEDRGETFTVHDAYVSREGSAGAWFPILAENRGRLALAWWHPSGAILVATSKNGGRSWSKPVRWSNAAEAVTSPWASFARDGSLEVAWHAKAPGGQLSVNVARGPLDRGPLTRGVVTTSSVFARGGNSDFTHFTHLPDGRILIVWADGSEDANVMHLAVERRARAPRARR